MKPALAAVGVVVALCGPVANSAVASMKPWPPDSKRGASFVHFGEEHVDDADGPRILRRVVAGSARYGPDLVALSGDKDDDNSIDTFERWLRLLGRYDRRGIPYFAAVGNHDRSPPGTEGVGSALLGGDISNYLEAFAARPYPFGDARPYPARRLQPRRRPSSDPDGASTHYTVSFGATRWVFLDNSCFSFFNCDAFQMPGFAGQSSYDYLEAQAATADERNQLLFVVMHMPTQDPRPLHTEPTPAPHTMGEGLAPDNLMFEQAAAANGVDGVFAGHVKGQWTYDAGGVPYFTDGGGGGEVYVGPAEQTGVDYGYWHGYRLLRVYRGRLRSDAVPVFVRGGITITGPAELKRRTIGVFSAIGEQPTEAGPEVNLELRDPDPSRPNAANLPAPARIWTTANRRILKPVPSAEDDPRRNPRTQTDGGRFRARCPGRTRVRITSGWEQRRFRVKVPSRPGALVKSIAGGGRVTGGRPTTIARVGLAQPARIVAEVRRSGRLLERLSNRCESGHRPAVIRWNGMVRGRAADNPIKLVLRILSDRRPIVRRYRLHVR